MRILLGSLYPNLGGSNRVLLAAARALATEHEVIVRAPLSEASHPAPAAIPVAPLVGPGAKIRILPHLASVLARELVFVRRTRPDILYVHDEPALYVYGVLGRLTRRPVIWHVHMTVGGGLTGRLRDALCDRRIAISRFAVAERPSTKPTALLRNPLLSPPPSPASAVPNRLSLCVVGASSPRKNQALALETLRVLRERGRDADLILVGPEIDPAYSRTLRDRAHALNLMDRVVFAGARPPGQAWPNGAVALFPSIYENQPLALVEALAGGFPLVAADIPAHREILADVEAEPGCLVRHDPIAFADAVERAARTPANEALARRTAALFSRERFDEAVRALFRKLDAGSTGW